MRSLYKRGPSGPLFIVYKPLDIDLFLTYTITMYASSILKEFTQFTEKSAAMMGQLPPAATITSPPSIVSPEEGKSSQSLTSPTAITQSPPRVAAMPSVDNNSKSVEAPKPTTEPGKPLKSIKF